MHSNSLWTCDFICKWKVDVRKNLTRSLDRFFLINRVVLKNINEMKSSALDSLEASIGKK